jgi:two-component system response regulator FixJ
MSENGTVYIVDDDEAVRDVISNLVKDMGLESQAFCSAEDFLSSYKRTGTDCLVLDVRMAGMSGMELLEILAKEKIAIPVILVTGHGDIPMAVEALQSGAVDFIEKPFREQTLWEKISKALKTSDDAYNFDSDRQNLETKISLLTKKESEIFKYILAGKTDKQIGNDLDCARRTAAFHRGNLLEKLEFKTVVELAKTMTRLNISI